MAPFSKWNQTTTNQVVSVIKELKEKHGYDLKNIAVYGDSAGGNLTLALILKIQDMGIGMPTVVVVFSPWTDLTLSGDTIVTLNDDDPLLNPSV